MKKQAFSTIFAVILSCLSWQVSAQVAINTDGSAPDPSAGLDISFNNKGALLPRLSIAEISSIPGPANGLVVFCTTDNKFYAYIGNSSAWKEILFGPGTIAPTCGFALSVNHLVSGGVSPVGKTVTYGTATGIPGEPSKCWITSNLGSDHQATSVDDATEASAGWYWRFNQKQGYRHDGVIRTPNTAWTNSISENSDWITTNDPCAIELGSAWRIPTYTEWTNVNTGGAWANWNGPWNSGLKMHAAGVLTYSDGSLGSRGSYGDYWSSAQFDGTFGWNISFNNITSPIAVNYKAYGFSIRCLKD